MIEDKLAQVGLRLPAAAKPSFAYATVTLHDGVGYVSGQLPKIDGEVRVFGKVGREVTLDAARKEARVCALQALACLKEALGDLSRLRRVLPLFASSAPARTRPRGARAAGLHAFRHHRSIPGRRKPAAPGGAAHGGPLSRGREVRALVDGAFDRERRTPMGARFLIADRGRRCSSRSRGSLISAAIQTSSSRLFARTNFSSA